MSVHEATEQTHLEAPSLRSRSPTCGPGLRWSKKMTFQLTSVNLSAQHGRFCARSAYHPGGIFYLVGLAIDVLRGTFRTWAACFLNNTVWETLKNIHVFIHGFWLMWLNCGKGGFTEVRFKPWFGNFAPFPIHLHWFRGTLASAPQVWPQALVHSNRYRKKHFPANGVSVPAFFYASPFLFALMIMAFQGMIMCQPWKDTSGHLFNPLVHPGKGCKRVVVAQGYLPG